MPFVSVARSAEYAGDGGSGDNFARTNFLVRLKQAIPASVIPAHAGIQPSINMRDADRGPEADYPNGNSTVSDRPIFNVQLDAYDH